MTAIIAEKLCEIFLEAVMRGHPGGVIRAAGPGSLFLPDPDHEASAQIMAFANERLEEHPLQHVAATAFAMIDGHPRVRADAEHPAHLSRSMLFAGSTITLRWRSGIMDGWPSLKFAVSPPDEGAQAAMAPCAWKDSECMSPIH